MEQKYTTLAQEALGDAVQSASAAGNPQVEPLHLLDSLLRQENGVIGGLIEAVGANRQTIGAQVRNALVSLPSASGSSTAQASASRQLTTALADASKEMKDMGDEYISTEHLLLGILDAAPNEAAKILEQNGITADKVRAAIPNVRGGAKVTSPDAEASYKALEKFSTDLTARAREGKLDPVIGRDQEIRRVIQILSRRTKNNPVLIGEPGVGKTAVVEGLAQKINAGDVPETLKGKQVYSLDLGSMVAGSRYRGDFEERLKKVLKEIKTRGDIVLFIDEIHTIVGAGSADGALGASDMLKPMLARGELQTIGATTTDEYRKYIEKDAALERRFQPIQVSEPSIAETIEILKGLRARYENHHHVTITDGALQSAAELSARYIQDRNLPDKAIDLIDEAGARLRIKRLTAPPELKELDNRIARIAKEKDQTIKDQQFEKAAELRDKQEKLEAERKEKEKSWREGESDVRMVVDEDVIAEVISQSTGIPVFKLTQAESKKLMSMEKELHKRIIGQDEAVSALSRSIRRARVGLKDPKRPAGSFIFAGPTGVGKTELAKALAEFLFDDEKAMIRIDMSEYMEKSSVSRLIGAAPGYVGYEEGGQLTEAVRRRPYSVVLFDEVEKANPEVFDVLLQVLDDGRLTDGQGRTVDFKNTILIMTSNLGSQFLVNPDLDEQQKKDAVMNAVHSQFRPEFLNRLDDMVIFHPLTRQELGKIVDLQVKQVASRLTDRRITLDVTEAAREWLADTGYDPAYGARPLRRLVQTEVGDQLARMLLAGEIKDGDTVLVDHTGGEHLELTDHTHNPMEGDPNPGDSQITVDDKKDDGEQKDA